MSRPFVLVTGPVSADASRVAQVLGELPQVRHRAGIRLDGVWALLDRQLQSRDGLQRTPDGALPDWVNAAVVAYLGLVPTLRCPALAVVDAPELWHQPALLRALSDQAVILTVLDDPRRNTLDPDAAPIDQTIQWGADWARSVQAAWPMTQSPRCPVIRLWRPDAHTALASIAHTLVRQPLRSRLDSQPPLAWDPLREAALRADPCVDPTLRMVGLPLPPRLEGLPHPTIAVATGEAALAAGDYPAAFDALAAAGTDLRAACLKARLYRVTGKYARAAEALRPFLDHGSGPDQARIVALETPESGLSADVAAAVGSSDAEPVRAAFAHWLVAKGMDAEAAELVAWMEGTGWRNGVRTRPS
jgi:hypothetical protein